MRDDLDSALKKLLDVEALEGTSKDCHDLLANALGGQLDRSLNLDQTRLDATFDFLFRKVVEVEKEAATKQSVLTVMSSNL